jgi:demethylmenaquinone methyltransferase/2-methoxy-6-polyprenyl-1,4-benzoquinol methylase
MPPDPERARRRYRRHADGYDASCRRTQPLRREAVAMLRLEPGDTVLDVGSGTGLSFELLEERVGPAGRVVGVELSPEMMAHARAKVSAAGWDNVVLHETTVEAAPLPADIDAILCFYTHDVMRSEQALERVFARARPGARVVVAGMKLFPWYLGLLNVYALAKAWPYMTTFEGLARPWSHVLRWVPNLEVKPTQLGMGYIAAGTRLS